MCRDQGGNGLTQHGDQGQEAQRQLPTHRRRSVGNHPRMAGPAAPRRRPHAIPDLEAAFAEQIAGGSPGARTEGQSAGATPSGRGRRPPPSDDSLVDGWARGQEPPHPLGHRILNPKRCGPRIATDRRRQPFSQVRACVHPSGGVRRGARRCVVAARRDRSVDPATANSWKEQVDGSGKTQEGQVKSGAGLKQLRRERSGREFLLQN